MIRVAIVEDERAQRELVHSYLSRFTSDYGETFSITDFVDGEDIIANYSSAFDIILMDIEMASMDGMTTARKIREHDTNVTIIFITNMAQYAISGYEVHAFDYMLKPLTYTSFGQHLHRALTHIASDNSPHIVISSKGISHRIALSSILWVESHGHRLTYYTSSGVFETTVQSMKEISDKLSSEGFFRCNKSYLINLSHVRSFVGHEVEIGQSRIPVSRTHRHSFVQALADSQM